MRGTPLAHHRRMHPQGPGIYTVVARHRFRGIELGARMTVVQMPTGDVWLHSPIAIDDDLEAEISELGIVSAIVAPNLMHHTFLEAASGRFPAATVYAPVGLAERAVDVEAVVLGGDRQPFAPAIEVLEIDGAQRLSEFFFLHPGSRCLIVSDLLSNVQEASGFWQRLYLRATGVLGRPGTSRIVRFAIRDRKAFRTSLEAVLERDFDRIIVAHGAVVTDQARSALAGAFDLTVL